MPKNLSVFFALILTCKTAQTTKFKHRYMPRGPLWHEVLNLAEMCCPRQHHLAIALREIGRVERTLFIIDWLLDAGMQRRAQIGLNKGESHHALKNALRIGRQGEIRDRTTKGQHYPMADLNLLTAIIIYCNTNQLGNAVEQRKSKGLDCHPELLGHTSPLGWAHIQLTGEYRWPKL